MSREKSCPAPGFEPLIFKIESILLWLVLKTLLGPGSGHQRHERRPDNILLLVELHHDVAGDADDADDDSDGHEHRENLAAHDSGSNPAEKCHEPLFAKFEILNARNFFPSLIKNWNFLQRLQKLVRFFLPKPNLVILAWPQGRFRSLFEKESLRKRWHLRRIIIRDQQCHPAVPSSREKYTLVRSGR